MAAVPFGSEITVNTIPAGNQYRPFLTKLANGGFLVGWQDDSGLVGAGTQDDVRFAVYGGTGTRLTSGDLLPYPTAAVAPGEFAWSAAQFEGEAAGFADGTFVMVWRDYSATGGDDNNGAIRARVFNPDGSPAGGLIDVNTTFPLIQSEPSVAVLTGGRFVVTWTSQIVSASSTTDIIRRVFNADGSPVTGEQTVNTQLVGDQNNSTVHALSGGGFAVVWDDREESSTTLFQTRTFIRFYNANGTALGNPIFANQSAAGDPIEVGLAELASGSIVLTWTELETASPGDGSGSAIKARIYNPASGLFGAAFTVNTTITNDQSDAQVAALSDGQFVVVWTDRSSLVNDLSFAAVRMQVFSAAGAKVGSEVLVNSDFTFEQQNPAITVLADGRFVIAWEDNSQTGADTQGYAIRARIYDARLAAIDLDGTAGEDTFVGTEFDDTINGLGGADTLRGGDGFDLIFGGIGADTLIGEDGNDTLKGEEGADTLNGGAGDDILIGGGGGDALIGGPGSDTASYAGAAARVKVALDGSIVFEGDALGDTFSSIARLTGTGSSDVLIGDANGNVIRGGSSNDTIRGQAGNDILYGDKGADNISGNAGDDRFSFSAIDQRGDTINDFTNAPGNNDSFGFLGTAFGGLPVGALAASRFTANTTGVATSANHRFIYETDTGILRFDSNGSAAGGSVLMAVLTGAPTLTAADIVIF